MDGIGLFQADFTGSKNTHMSTWTICSPFHGRIKCYFPILNCNVQQKVSKGLFKILGSHQKKWLKESKGTWGWGPYFPYLITWRNLRWLNWMKTGWIPWDSIGDSDRFEARLSSHFPVDLWSHCRFTKDFSFLPTLSRARKTPSVQIEDF